MNDQDRNQILSNSARLEEWENTPTPLPSEYDDMSREELIKLVKLQQERYDRLVQALERAEARAEASEARANRSDEKLHELLEEVKANSAKIAYLTELLAKRDKELADSRNQEKKARASKFASSSQKSKHSKPHKDSEESKQGGEATREDNLPSTPELKDDFSVPGSVPDLPKSGEIIQGGDYSSVAELPKPKEARPYRRGVSIGKINADNKVLLKSDPSLLPEGYEFIGIETRSVFGKVTSITQYDYEMVIAKKPNGETIELYLPANPDEEKVVDKFPGTMATHEMMASVVVDHFCLNVPYYRLAKHMRSNGMSICRSTFINWLKCGAKPIQALLPHLLDKAIESNSIINCDETWFKVKVHGKYTKKYIWCLVNKELKIVIFFYKGGARSRDALKDILGERLPMAIQTDGYNVYTYLDDQLNDVTHLCCMAHARAKFKETYDITKEEDALYFLERIRDLYFLERQYRERGYTADQIKERRNDARTIAIIGEMRSKIDAMKAEGHPPRSELLEKAINYMDHFWKQLFAYRENGRFEIDNSIAERNIRPIANERKNSYFYGSNTMAEISAAYRSIISTCKMWGVSVVDYFTKFFWEIIKGNQDYPKLLPMTIGLPVNKY